MNKLDLNYHALLNRILISGTKKQDRTGTGTISIFGQQIRHRMSDGFPLLTTKKMHFKSIVTELVWFLRGDTNIKFLVDNRCNIWTGDAYKKYMTGRTTELLSQEEFSDLIRKSESFAKTHGELGPIYGAQWRNWEGIDQISNLINDLKTNPDSRRLMVNAWNVAELGSMTLPPCHYGFQLYTRDAELKERIYLASKEPLFELLEFGVGEQSTDEHCHQVCDSYNIPRKFISLMWNQRSCDVPLGLPFNVASYGLLLVILAKCVNMFPMDLVGNLGDCHIYNNQIDGVMEQLEREPFQLPGLILSNDFDWENSDLDSIVNWVGLHLDTFYTLKDYSSHPSIKFPLSN